MAKNPQEPGAVFGQHYQDVKVEDLRWDLRADCAQCDFGKVRQGQPRVTQQQVLAHVRTTGHAVTTQLHATERFSAGVRW